MNKVWISNISLRTRLSLLLTGLLAIVLIGLGSLWVKGTRASIFEEIESATRVSEQWIHVISRQAAHSPSGMEAESLLGLLQSAGRIRANALEVVDGAGQRLYLSPPPTYKQDHSAPSVFASMVEPVFTDRRIQVGDLTVLIHPDPSRATLDAWDDLCEMAIWAVAFLLVLFVGARVALDRALRPLDSLISALDRTGRGRFDIRLPVHLAPELGRLARAYNGMADRLVEAVNENVRLENDQEMARCLELLLEKERRNIARELHDELAQGITAVRALAGAIAQRSDDHLAVQLPAKSIIDVTGELQEGVRKILQHLRSTATKEVNPAIPLQTFLSLWHERNPHLSLAVDLEAGLPLVSDKINNTLLRILQEGLTNTLRHAAATKISVAFRHQDGWLELSVTDDGCGLEQGASAQAGCGLGLLGIRERMDELGGCVELVKPVSGGCRLQARLPLAQYQCNQEMTS